MTLVAQGLNYYVFNILASLVPSLVPSWRHFSNSELGITIFLVLKFVPRWSIFSKMLFLKISFFFLKYR